MSAVIEVPLSQGYVALIDVVDADRVLAHRWHAKPHRRTVYAQRNVRRADGGWTSQCLHQFLTGYAKTDHRDGNGLNNRRSNLREATADQNNRNSRQRSDNTSGFKGVHRHKPGKWQARISVGDRRRSLGYFPTAEEAAHAYDAAARELHGEYATVNFPEPGERAA